MILPFGLFFFFFNDTATTEIYTLSLHDALPISKEKKNLTGTGDVFSTLVQKDRSEEHTSELQSHSDLVCRLLLEKKKKYIFDYNINNNKNQTTSNNKKSKNT